MSLYDSEMGETCFTDELEKTNQQIIWYSIVSFVFANLCFNGISVRMFTLDYYVMYLFDKGRIIGKHVICSIPAVSFNQVFIIHIAESYTQSKAVF